MQFTLKQGTAASSGDNTLVAAPGAGKRIVVYDFVIANEDSTPTPVTAILRADGETTSGWRVRLGADGAFLARRLYGKEVRWMLPENKALELNLSGAVPCGYTIRYSISPLV